MRAFVFIGVSFAPSELYSNKNAKICLTAEQIFDTIINEHSFWEQAMERHIVHADFNSFFASVECYKNPELKDKPVAVAGDPKKRHGIILARNEHAKKFGVKTAEPIWQAKMKCKNLILVEPHMNEYMEFSKRAYKIYTDYTPRVEAFGLDECWLDISYPKQTMEQATQIADEIRNKIKRELGITVSVGLANNKIFAKLASDLKKPDALTVITQQNYKKVLWGLPADMLLYIGESTYRKLRRFGIFTIGDLANTSTHLLESMLGKHGLVLYNYANGLDDSEVRTLDYKAVPKSIGNSVTLPRDLTTLDEVRSTFMLLSDKVGARLREQGLCCCVLQIYVRDFELNTGERQMRLPYPTDITDEIANAAMELFRQHYPFGFRPIRSLGVRGTHLVGGQTPIQMTLFDDLARRERHRLLDKACDEIRQKYGKCIIQRGSAKVLL